MKKKKTTADYGNWVPRKLLFLWTFLALCDAIIFWGIRDNKTWATLCVILFIACLALLLYLGILYYSFSPKGGDLMNKVHRYVAKRLPWDGKGKLLDVGCGAGALTIRCAKQFPEAECTGIDYWGMKWDYSQKKCLENARAEGVESQCIFQHGDANHLDFEDETFDAVVSNFVYHEVNDDKSKEELLRETLRVLKKGGAFALQDLFGQKSVYGDFQQIVDRLKGDMVSEIHYTESASEIPIPSWMEMPGMLRGVGIIYGKK